MRGAFAGIALLALARAAGAGMVGDFAPFELGLTWKYSGTYSYERNWVGMLEDYKVIRSLAIDSVADRGGAHAYRFSIRDSLYNRSGKTSKDTARVARPDSVIVKSGWFQEGPDGSISGPDDEIMAAFFILHLVPDSLIHRSVDLAGGLQLLTDTMVVSGYQCQYAQDVGLLNMRYNYNRVIPYEPNISQTFRLIEFNGIAAADHIIVAGLRGSAPKASAGAAAAAGLPGRFPFRGMVADALGRIPRR